MKLLKAGRNTKSAAEYAAIEAENNRRAIVVLRRALRKCATASEIVPMYDIWPVLDATTPKKLRGGK